ncbi:MAG: galactose oxidase-like domain-containing protein [Pseudonocardiaceae bacterium]
MEQSQSTPQSSSLEKKGDKDDPRPKGEWGTIIELENVAVHTHVLPNGKVLYWGRRPYKYPYNPEKKDEGITVKAQDEAGARAAEEAAKQGNKPKKEDFNNHQDHHECTPLIWDPNNPNGQPEPTEQPECGVCQCAVNPSKKVNLFCGGHAFMPDGRLLVAGGHCEDGVGTTQACAYDYKTNKWAPLPVMSKDLGRWYPTVTTLADGRMLVMGGTSNGKTNTTPQVWDGHDWACYKCPGPLTPNYPCMHVAPDGRVCISGPQGGVTWFFDPKDKDGRIMELPSGGRACGHRDYAPSVMYDAGKIIYIGGGNDKGDWRPSNRVEVIDLKRDNPEWRETSPMHYRRRQHNATILADGTVLVTGGTQGGGAERPVIFMRRGFNNLEPGNPVHEPELWDPETGKWTLLADEGVDRCYHSTAVLLPDATVLSAGGGEYDVAVVGKPWWKHNHTTGRVFKPPYLFRGERPEITPVDKATINYGDEFTLVASASGPEIGKVTLVRLSSVTHTINQNQRFNSLAFRKGEAGKVSVTAPEKPEICPPGHYMLFAISTAGVPSIAQIIQILAKVPPAPAKADTAPKETVSYTSHTEQVDDAVMAESTGTRVTVGLATQCIYGLGACWGGAYQALTRLNGVAAVGPVANAEDSTAEVYLRDGGLPDLDNWPGQFTSIVNGSYDFRGVEVTITGAVREHHGTLRLTGPSVDHPVTLRPLAQGTKLQWDPDTHRARDATLDELDAYQQLAERYRDRTGEAEPMSVTGPLTKTDTEWNLYVRVAGG